MKLPTKILSQKITLVPILVGGVAIIVVLVGYFLNRSSQAPNSVATEQKISPVDAEVQIAQVQATYQVEANKLASEITQVLNQNTGGADELSNLREKLLKLSVPTAAKDWHLAIVLKLSAIVELMREATTGKQVNQVQLAKLKTDVTSLAGSVPAGR